MRGKFMKKINFILFLIICLVQNTAHSELVPGKSIGNDSEKEKLCVSRLPKGAKQIPFEIDQKYADFLKHENPDTTLIAVKFPTPSLVSCFLRPGTGRYEPDSFQSENKNWGPVRPAGYSPILNTEKGQQMGMKICIDAAQKNANSPDYDHGVIVNSLHILGDGNLKVSGIKANEYDAIGDGYLFFKSTGPDLKERKFRCLLDSAMDVKAIDLK